MKILLTGSAGFIGSHVSRALLELGHTVVGIDNFNDYYNIHQKENNVASLEKEYPNTFTIVRGDILNEKLLNDLFAAEKFDKVCHLAARAGVRPSIADPFLYEQVNVRGTLNMLEACKNHNVKKIVYASSSSVYGQSKTVPFSETQTLRPISPYASTKFTNENDAHVYNYLHGISTIGLRFFTVYGPSGRPDMAPYLFTDWISKGKPVKKFGDGSTSRDYTYIDDIVSGVIAALEYETEYDIFNLGNSQTVTLNEFIKTIETLLRKEAIIEQCPMFAGDVSHTFADISHAKDKLGYDPKTTIVEGMEKFIEWYSACGR